MYKSKEDQKVAAHRHYLKNKNVLKERAKNFRILARRRNRLFINNILENSQCVDCGEKDILVLDFDHVQGIKVDNISHASNNAWSLERLQLEINKCEIRCANCHRRRTFYSQIPI